jgi:hypothetical protein
MKKNILTTTTLIALFGITTLFILSCGILPKNEENGFVRFQVSTGITASAWQEVEESYSLMVSVKKWRGRMVYERKIIELYKMGNGFISEPLELEMGKYELTEFLAVDEQKRVAYATPIEGSNKAYLADDPLPIAFSVSRDKTETVNPQVLGTEGATPEDFGYTGFSFNVVETIVFRLSVFVRMGTDKELTEAALTVSSGGEVLYYGGLKAQMNQIEVRGGYGTYNVTIEKEGYKTYEQSCTEEELKGYFGDIMNVILYRPLTHYIKFKANGVEKVFDLGLTEVEENAFGEVLGGATILFAAPETYANIDPNPFNFIGIVLDGATPDTYTWDIGFLDMNYTVDQAEYSPVSGGSVTIIEFGDVGGDITGTFSATVQFSYSPNPPPLDSTIHIIDGEFKVKRIPDDSWDPFGGP